MALAKSPWILLYCISGNIIGVSMTRFGLLKGVICFLLFCAFLPKGTFPSPAGYNFGAVPKFNDNLQPEIYISFFETDFKTSIYSDSSGFRRKESLKGKWQQEKDKVYLKYNSGKIDTAIIYVVSSELSPPLQQYHVTIYCNGIFYSSVGTNAQK
jgi:hypothetical protein